MIEKQQMDVLYQAVQDPFPGVRSIHPPNPWSYDVFPEEHN